ncbi:MAG: DUF2817 domain-containing protein [Chloroflexi bacterium]|nr:DUF2817 domain-containing protein [Chloroflexota bacterium]
MPVDGFHYKLLPIQNPYGYDHFVRQNARGVDVNRNFDCGWADLPDHQDVSVPWDYNYKGARPASEPETQIIQALIQRYRPRCVLDLHTAHYILLLSHRGDLERMHALHREIGERLNDRFLTQRPYGGPYQQVNMEQVRRYEQPQPYLFQYAAEQGAPIACLVELSGNRDDTHALVMNTDTVVTICVSAINQARRLEA